MMTVKYVRKIIAPFCHYRALVFRVTVRVSFKDYEIDEIS
jgi:hypothetical protein